MNKDILIASIACFLSVLLLFITLITVPNLNKFTPPPFESDATYGTPADAGDSWGQIYKEGMSFSAHVCGRVVPNGNKADVYFTNDEGNSVWLKLRVLDENEKIIAETGLLKPGQYVKSIKFKSGTLTEGAKITMKIMAYEPETYYSEGAVTLTTVIG